MDTPRAGDRDTRPGAGGATSTAPVSRPLRAADPAVEVRDLRCRYGDFEAVRGIDLQVHHGELLAVLGTNGAGKTTTMEVLEGRRRADDGWVSVLGRDPHRERRTLAARVGVVFQESALPDELTPREFLHLWHRVAGGGKLAHRPVEEQLARVDLAHRRNVRIGALSGGERRRLDLAIALSADPQVLFLDEPTAGLDPESRADTWELIRGLLRTGTTVVLTTHHLEEAEALADHLAVMHEGHIVVDGTLEQVLGTRDARIRFDLDGDVVLPTDLAIGHVEQSRDRGRQRVDVRTSALADDLRRVLAWAAAEQVELRRLHASEPSLAEVFHDVRANTSGEIHP